ncbi:MAG: carboxypeptidase-like regulatory domain-containing protein, partial [Gemmatimonadales bacterium]
MPFDHHPRGATFFLRVLAGVALLALVPSVAAAQSGAVSGTVRGSDGLPLNGARVSVALPARVATTDQDGRYALRELPAGH